MTFEEFMLKYFDESDWYEGYTRADMEQAFNAGSEPEEGK